MSKEMGVKSNEYGQHDSNGEIYKSGLQFYWQNDAKNERFCSRDVLPPIEPMFLFDIRFFAKTGSFSAVVNYYVLNITAQKYRHICAPIGALTQFSCVSERWHAKTVSC